MAGTSESPQSIHDSLLNASDKSWGSLYFRREPANSARDLIIYSLRLGRLVLPDGDGSADYLGFYAEHFHTVEIDSTFYARPTARTVGNWAARTPEGFIFSVKVPQTITHERVLTDCDAELTEFLGMMDILGPKLDPIVFQCCRNNARHIRDVLFPSGFCGVCYGYGVRSPFGSNL